MTVSPRLQFVLAATLGGVPALAQSLVRSLPANHPPLLDGGRLAALPATGRLVLFGGLVLTQPSGGNPPGLAVTDATHEFDGVRWSARALAVKPGARYGHGLCGDGNRIVLFGGDDYASAPTMFGDTWTYDASGWQQQQPATSPGPRTGMAMAHDVARNRVVLFGGADATQAFGDTWEWDGSTWNQVSTAAAPTARWSPAMAYDLPRARCVLFGGSDQPGTMVDDTWLYDGTTWAAATPTSVPPARALAQLTLDLAAGVCVLSGGADAQLQGLGDLWHWNGSDWSPSAISLLEPRTDHAAAADLVGQRTVIYGGSSWNGMSYDHVDGTDSYRAGGSLTASYVANPGGCAGTGGVVPTLAGVPGNVPVQGTSLVARIGQVDPAVPVVIVAMGFSNTTWGGAALPRDLTPSGLAGCRLDIALDGAIAVGPDANGEFLWRIDVPVVPALTGLVFFNQALVPDRGAQNGIAALTNSCTGTVQ